MKQAPPRRSRRPKPLLQGKTIGVQTASTGAAFVDKYLKGVVEVREYKTTEEHDPDLDGRPRRYRHGLDGLPDHGCPKKPGNEDMTTTGPRFQGGFLGRGSSVGLRKTDTELKAMLNDGDRRRQGVTAPIKTLSEKWFGFDVTPK